MNFKNNKKAIIAYGIGLSIFFIIVAIVVIICIKQNEKNKPTEFDLLKDDSVFQENINIYLDITDNTKIKKNEEEYLEENIRTYKYSTGEIQIDEGEDIILSSSYIVLTDRFDLIEVLVGFDGAMKYLNDSQLSTSYSYANYYSKKWYVVDKTTDIPYLAYVDSRYSLTLNAKIVEDNLEADMMIVNGVNTDVDHIKIPLDTFSYEIIQGNQIEIRDYSIFKEELSFNDKNLQASIENLIDLDGNGVKESVKINFYNNCDLTGFYIKINDIEKTFKLDEPSHTVYIIDLDKTDKYKELLISSRNPYSDENVETYIISFVNGDIVTTFHSSFGFNEFKAEEDNEQSFKNFEVSLEDDGSFKATFIAQDNVQNWVLNAFYKLDENHKFVLYNKNYYEVPKGEEITTTNNVEIVAYDEMNYIDADKTIIPPNSVVKFIGTTLKYWVVIEYNEKTYYIPLDKNGKIKGLNTLCGEVFEGLAIAD